jgi:hypothetical protein
VPLRLNVDSWLFSTLPHLLAHITALQMEEQREVVEYEPPRSVASSPPTTPGTPLRSQLSNGNLPAAATANPGGSVGGTSVSTTPAASTGYAAPRAVPVSPAAPLLPASHSPAHTPVPAVAAAVLSPSASNVHASVNLLDMDDGPAPSASAPRLTLIECGGAGSGLSGPRWGGAA